MERQRFRPLIAVANCAILGSSHFMQQRFFEVSESAVYGLGSELVVLAIFGHHRNEEDYLFKCTGSTARTGHYLYYNRFDGVGFYEFYGD